MDIVVIIISFVLSLSGLLGAMLPVVPGPPLSWLGLLTLYLAPSLEFDVSFIVYTFIIAMAVFVMDFIIPSLGTKKFGGSKKGAIGSILGLSIGLFLPIPGGFLLCAFMGAYIGELINNTPSNLAFKAAIGSFVGFIVSTFMKIMLALIYLGLQIKIIWTEF